MSHVSPLQGLSQEQLKDYTLFKLVMTKEEENSSAESKDGPSEKQQVSEVV